MLKELRSVLGLSLGHFVIDIYSPVIPAVLPVLIATHGYSYFLAGLLVAAFNITSSLLQPTVGWLSDRKDVTVRLPVPSCFLCLHREILTSLSETVPPNRRDKSSV